MTLRSLLLSTAVLGLASAGSLWAAQNAEETQKTRRIVRVISSPHAEEVDIDLKSRVVIAGEGGPSAPHLLAGLSHRRGYLGVQMVDLTSELRGHFGGPEDAGVMISSVAADSPAAEAGLKVGDVLTAIDGESMTSGLEVARRISSYDDGRVANLEVWRNREARALTATIVERERPAIDIGRMALPDLGTLQEFVWVGPDKLQAHVIEIDQGGLQEALHELELRFGDPDFVKKLQVLGQDRLDLQVRIQELETRLKDLERQLDNLPRQ